MIKGGISGRMITCDGSRKEKKWWVSWEPTTAGKLSTEMGNRYLLRLHAGNEFR